MTARIRSGLALGAAALLLTGCTPPAQPPPASLHCPFADGAPVAVTLGTRATSATPEIPTVVVAPMQTAARQGAQMTVIRADGAPQVVFSQAFSSTAQNGPARASAQNAFVQTWLTAFGVPARARAAQADPLRALGLAADATPAGGTIVMVDSGLQTVAPLRFQDDGGRLLDSAPTEIVDYLRHARQESLVPDLSGRSVVFVGLGRTAGAQPPPDQGVRTRLGAIWTAIAKAGGAGCVEVRPEPPTSGTVPAGLPAVTPVPMPRPAPPPVPCGTTVLSDHDVSFVADRATFKDPAAARATISKVADQMRGRRTTSRLTGTTANVNDYPGQVALSRSRAAAVGDVLVSMGIGRDRISTRGLGSRFDGYVRDHDAHGVLLPGPASTNRKVIVQLICPPA